MDQELVRVSKRMSYVLRHRPDAARLRMDEHGWVAVDDLLAALRISRQQLDAVVTGNDKQRFSVESGPEGRDRIRANQGHTIPVDLDLAPVPPPDRLYHGTTVERLDSIIRDGLHRGQRHHVHLSGDVATAVEVGRRHRNATVAVLVIDSGAMARAGYEFYRSANGVWLIDHVPARYIARQ